MKGAPPSKPRTIPSNICSSRESSRKANTVAVPSWCGTSGPYEVLEGNYWKGSVSIFLTGKKLKGEWSLQRVDNEGGKTKWLFRKTNGNAKPISAKRYDLLA